MDQVTPDTIERAQGGDPDACRSIVEAFQRPVHHTVYRLVGARFPADVEDITQDIFVKLFRSLPTFDLDRGTRFSTWVFTFVKNYCFDVLKRRRLRVVPLDGHGEDGDRALDPPHPDQGPVEALASQELDAAISHAVGLLPKDQRLAFVLREYEGLSYLEIAEVTQVSEGTVKSRIHRAKEALRYRLQRWIQDDVEESGPEVRAR